MFLRDIYIVYIVREDVTFFGAHINKINKANSRYTCTCSRPAG